MLKNFTIKIYFQVVMILLISIIGMGVGSAQLKYSIVEPSARFSEEAQFVATVSGTSVSFDWSAMVEANYYTMAVALSDANGDIDMGSLALLDMGTPKTFSTSGLPSGVIFYAVIVADTDQGKVVSNTVEFMPFAGTVTVPNTGTVLMQLDDPGGVGTITIFGTRDAAAETVMIDQIAGDTGFDPFVLTVVDDRPKTYTQGDLTMTFTYAADGTVDVQSVQNNVRSVDKLSSCQQIVSDKINTLTEYAEANSMLTVLTLHTNTKQNAAMMGKWWKRLIDSNDSYAKLYDKIRVPRNAHIINKSQYDCFYGTNLDELLRHNDIETLIICGVMTNLCVETTARSAFVRGYRVILPIDATAAYNLEFHKSTCLNLAFGFAHICLTEDLWEIAND